MKKLPALTIILFLFSILTTNKTQAQDCHRLNFCQENMDDFDYRAQSVFGYAYPGDTVIIKTAVYSNKKYNFLLCSSPELGEIQWEIVKPIRKTRKKIVKIHVDTNYIYKYKRDAQGNIVYEDEYDEENDEYNQVPVYELDANGEQVVDKIEITRDTLFKPVRYTDLVSVFKSGKENHFKHAYRKTQRVWIRFVIPKDADEEGGCYGMFIGRQQMTSKRKFRR
jgi:hypothetical protein